MVDLSHLDLRLDLLERWASEESGAAWKASMAEMIKAVKFSFDGIYFNSF